MAKDYSQYEDDDRHAHRRDKAREKRVEQRLMRGDRTVFEIQKSIVKRGRQARKRDDDVQY